MPRSSVGLFLYPGGWNLMSGLLQFSGWSISVDPVPPVRFLGSRMSLGYLKCLQSVCRKSILERFSAFHLMVLVEISLLSTRPKTALLSLSC